MDLCLADRLIFSEREAADVCGPCDRSVLEGDRQDGPGHPIGEAGAHRGGQCATCGAGVRYAALLVCPAEGEGHRCQPALPALSGRLEHWQH